MEYAKNFYRSLTVTQAVGLGAMLALLAGSIAYGPAMSAYNSRIVQYARADMVPVQSYITQQDQTIRLDNLKIQVLERTVNQLAKHIDTMAAAQK